VTVDRVPQREGLEISAGKQPQRPSFDDRCASPLFFRWFQPTASV